MRKERQIVNTNIRLNLQNESDRKAWEHLQKMDRTRYKSYSKVVVLAINDYFAREEKKDKDPFLESREREEQFLRSVKNAVEQGAKEAMPFVLAEQLLAILAPHMQEAMKKSGIATEKSEQFDSETDSGSENTENWSHIEEEETSMDAALEFMDAF